MADQPEQARSQSSLSSKMQRIDSLVSSLEGCPDPALRNTASELVSTLMELHRIALERILELLTAMPGHETLLQAMSKEPVTGGILLLHGLHPDDLLTRVNNALEQVRPSLRSHQGDVELLSIDDEVARLRLIGTCNGCPSSTSTFRNLIENAIYGMAPEIADIEVEGMSQPAAPERSSHP